LALLGYAAANLLGTDGEMWGVSAHHMMHHAKSCSSLFVYEFHLGIVSDVQEQHQTMEERFQVCSARTYKRNTTCSDIKNRVWATFFLGMF
jgi:hypothetical protein